MVTKIVKGSVLIYALILIALGIIGYYKSGSKISLMAGAGVGILLLVSDLLMYLGKRSGLLLATFFTLLMTAVSAYRYALVYRPGGNQHLLPALLSVLSGGMLIFLLLQVARWKRK